MPTTRRLPAGGVNSDVYRLGGRWRCTGSLTSRTGPGSIGRALVWRAVTGALVHWCTFPRKRRARQPLALSENERAVLLLILNSQRLADLALPSVFAMLLDEGRYHGSIRTMYRLPAWKRPDRKQSDSAGRRLPDVTRGRLTSPIARAAASRSAQQ